MRSSWSATMLPQPFASRTGSIEHITTACVKCVWRGTRTFNPWPVPCITRYLQPSLALRVLSDVPGVTGKPGIYFVVYAFAMFKSNSMISKLAFLGVVQGKSCLPSKYQILCSHDPECPQMVSYDCAHNLLKRFSCWKWKKNTSIVSSFLFLSHMNLLSHLIFKQICILYRLNQNIYF